MKRGNGTAVESTSLDVLHRVECRAWERQPCDLRTACQPIAASRGHELSWPAKIRDLSPGGVGLVIERRFEPGVILFLELTSTTSGSPETLMARVIHATPLARHRWLLGCAFCSRLSPAKIQSLLGIAKPPFAVPGGEGRPAATGLTAHGTVEGQPSPSAPKTPTDKGSAKPNPGEPSGAAPARKEANPGGLLRKNRNSFLILEGVTLEGTFREATGTLLLARFNLWASWPLAQGTGLFLRIIDPQGNPVGVRIRVTDCCQDGERWTIHYELVETPSAEALGLLGYSDGVTA
jgi:hypothetical protein